jgi:hypothetical protein
MTNVTRFSPGQLYQAADDEKAYTVNVGNWFTAPTSASTVIWENGTNRSASNLSSGATSTGATIAACFVTTPCIVALRVGVDYRVEVLVQQGGEILEGYFIITGVT